MLQRRVTTKKKRKQEELKEKTRTLCPGTLSVARLGD
jgi:hypothetical protein